MRVQNYFSTVALYRKLPIFCVAFLFELVTSCSASKCSYYQKDVNTISKVIMCYFRLLVVKLSDAFRSVLIASSFRLIFVLVLYSVLWRMSLLVELTILSLIPPLFGSTALFGPWPPALCSHPFGVPQQLHSLKGAVVSHKPKPHPGEPGNLLSGLPDLSRECPVLRLQVFSLTHLWRLRFCGCKGRSSC
jgi:hypothetical protein